jgi:hypothetical protein
MHTPHGKENDTCHDSEAHQYSDKKTCEWDGEDQHHSNESAAYNE